MTNAPKKPDEPLERRGDNVGQSGRWRRPTGPGDDAGTRRYGNEESRHSTEDAGHGPERDMPREPNADKPNASPYEGRRPSPEIDNSGGDDKSRYRDASYADPGGKGPANPPKHPGERWKDQGGAGEGEEYGIGRDAANPSEKR